MLTHNKMLVIIKTTKSWELLFVNIKREKLIHLRKEKKLIQKDVVLLLQKRYGIRITESYYGMIELGVRTPSLTIALAISELFNTDPNHIFFNI